LEQNQTITQHKFVSRIMVPAKHVNLAELKVFWHKLTQSRSFSYKAPIIPIYNPAVSEAQCHTARRVQLHDIA